MADHWGGVGDVHLCFFDSDTDDGFNWNWNLALEEAKNQTIMMKIYKHTDIINITAGVISIAAGILIMFGKVNLGVVLAAFAILIVLVKRVLKK